MRESTREAGKLWRYVRSLGRAEAKQRRREANTPPPTIDLPRMTVAPMPPRPAIFHDAQWHLDRAEAKRQRRRARNRWLRVSMAMGEQRGPGGPTTVAPPRGTLQPPVA